MGLRDGDAKQLPSYMNIADLKRYLEKTAHPPVQAVFSVHMELSGTYASHMERPTELTAENVAEKMGSEDRSVTDLKVMSSEITGYRCLGREREKRDDRYKECDTCPFYVDADVLRLLTEKK